MSFTDFEYSSLSITPKYVQALGASHSKTRATLTSVDVRVIVANVGLVDGDEVVQVYVSVPAVEGLPTPKWSLQAFAKVKLASSNTGVVAGHGRGGVGVGGGGGGVGGHGGPPYASATAVTATRTTSSTEQTLQFSLDAEQFSTVQHDGSRTITSGAYTVYVGGSQPDDPRAQSKVVSATFHLAHVQQASDDK